MADQWYFARDRQKYGPFSTAQMRQLAAERRLLATDMVHKDGESKWVAAFSVMGLFQQPRPIGPQGCSHFPGDSTNRGYLSVEWARHLAASGNITPALIALMLLICFPVGLYFVWQHPRWNLRERWLWTGAWGGLFLVGLLLFPLLIIGLSLTSTLALIVCVIWQHPRLTLQQKKIGTTVSISFLLICMCGGFLHMQNRSYQAAMKRVEEETRLKKNASMKMVEDANHLWTTGHQEKAIAQYKKIIEEEMQYIPKAELPNLFQRVIESEMEKGNTSSARQLIRKARRYKGIELELNNSKARELLREVEAQIAVEESAREQERIADAQKRKQERAEKNGKANKEREIETGGTGSREYKATRTAFALGGRYVTCAVSKGMHYLGRATYLNY